MPSATIIHAACFAVGAAVGAGAVAAVGISKHRAPPLAHPTDPRSVVKFGPSGLPDLAATAQQLPGTVLKYGNPGMSCQVDSLGCTMNYYMLPLQDPSRTCLYERHMSQPTTGDLGIPRG